MHLHNVDNEIRQIQELNRLEDVQKDLFGIALSEDAVAKEVKAAENPWLSPEHLYNLVARYMQQHITDGRNPFLGQGDLMTIMLSNAQRSNMCIECMSMLRNMLRKAYVGRRADIMNMCRTAITPQKMMSAS